MSIVSLQKRARQLGQIRLGTTKDGRPVSLNTVRLTSVAKGLLDQAAELWGGTVESWQPNEKSSLRWSLITETSELPVVIPPQDVDNISWYEHWGSGGLQRRCDGENIVNRDGDLPCVCDPDNRECNMVTRVNLMIPDLPDVGVWLLSSTGWYAATELAMSMQLVVQSMQKTGLLPEATLAIEQRETKRPGEPTKRYVVPTLRFADTLSTFLEQGPARHLPDGADGGEGEGTVQSLPEPSPTPIEATTVTVEMPKVGIADRMDDVVEDAAEDAAEAADDAVWADLLALLEDKPDEGTMSVVETRVRKLFRYMDAADLWGDADRTLHASLAKFNGVEHLTDLRKAELGEFAVKAFEAAKAKVSEDD